MSKNAKIIVKLLKERPHSIGAEIGVYKGETTTYLLKELHGLKHIVCVDLWVENEDFKSHSPNKSGEIFNANWMLVRKSFVDNVLKPNCERILAIQSDSLYASRLFPIRYFDWLFIDANHGYEFVKADIISWWPTLKKGGLMIGDDYINKPTYGVIQAVNEMFGGEHKTVGKIWHKEK